MSYTGMVFQVDNAECPGEFGQEIAFFIVQCRTSKVSNGFGAVNSISIAVSLDERSIPGVLDVAGDSVKRGSRVELIVCKL